MHHEFAFYYSQLHGTLSSSASLILSDESLVHRMIRVLRFKEGDTCILFDRHSVIKATIVNYDKKTIVLAINQRESTKQLQPAITVLLPLLKREALEEAVYQLTEVGVHTIQLITTKKAHRHSLMPKEFDRLVHHSIAAAEQAKNFYLPHIMPATSLHDALAKSTPDSLSIFFDMQGASIIPYCAALPSYQQITLLIGPEGDLAHEEKELVKKSHFKVCSLTKTVLRAQHAISLAASLFRLA